MQHQDIKKPIFIAGDWGSGTTLLRSMLNAHPDIFMPYESRYFCHLWQKRDTIPNGPLPDDSIPLIVDEVISAGYSEPLVDQDNREAVIEALQAIPLPERDLARVMAAISESTMQQQGKPRWGAKDPEFANQLDLIFTLYPGSPILYIIRDGRGVIASQLGKKFKMAEISGNAPPAYPTIAVPSGDSVLLQALQFAEGWYPKLKAMRQLAAMQPETPVMEIKYEDLVHEPQSILEQVCPFIDVPFDEAMLRYYESFESQLPHQNLQKGHPNIGKPPDPSITRRWMKALSPATIHAVQLLIGSKLQWEGYDLVELDLSDEDKQAVEQITRQWSRGRQRKAIRRKISDMAWLQPFRKLYHHALGRG